MAVAPVAISKAFWKESSCGEGDAAASVGEGDAATSVGEGDAAASGVVLAEF